MAAPLATPFGVLAAPALFGLGALLALLLGNRPAMARWAAGLCGLAGAAIGFAAALPVLLGEPEVRAELFRSAPFAPIGLRLDPRQVATVLGGA